MQRLKSESDRLKTPFIRMQMRFIFERFLVRVQAAFPHFVVKGGAALEFRLALARTTRDLDLGLYRVSGENILEGLQAQGLKDFDDFLTFEVEADRNHPILEADGMQYQGRRLRVRAKLAGKPFFSYFGVDIAVGESSQQPDQLTVPSLLQNAGLPPLELAVFALESHIAEKLHAYTLPRQHPNSRVKDLPDLALLAGHRQLEGQKLQAALQLTFDHRQTHPLPNLVPKPPDAWTPVYAEMAKENELPWKDLGLLWQRVSDFLNPALSGELNGQFWTPQDWDWSKS